MAGSDKNALSDSQKVDPTPDNDARMYQYSFWDKEVLEDRRKLFPIVILPLLYTTVLMWICLSIFWGSLSDNNNLTRIDVTAVNLDAGFVGETIIQRMKAMTAAGKNQLSWNFETGVVSDQASRQLILDEETWAVLQVSVNATSALTEALMLGDSSYSPLDAVTLYVASGRNQITTNSHVVPAIQALVSPILSQIAVNNTASFLHSIAGNKSASDVALRCPQCLASPFVLHSVDLIPFDNAAAAGATMTGLIFLLTFTFTIFQILRNAGIMMGERLKLLSAIAFRTSASLLAYLIMALWYSLINIAFGVPLHRIYGSAGFVIFWMLNACTMAAVGMPMESLFTLIGMKWAGYFLSLWIIVNVSGSFSSFNIMPSFYQYGYAFPFYHTIQGARTLIFGTKSHFGLNFGVLIAWMVAGVAGMYSIMFWRTKKNLSTGAHYVA